MPSLSDASDLAQSIYAPAAVAILSLVVILGFLNLQALFGHLFRWFEATFQIGEGPEEKGKPSARAKGADTVRLALIVFIVLAWPSFFHSLGNLLPFDFVYGPQSFHEENSAVLAEIACSHTPWLQPYEAIQFVRTFTADLDESVRSQVERAFGPIDIARSMLALMVCCLAVSLARPGLRTYRPGFIVTALVIIGYLGFSGFFSVDTALVYEASELESVAKASLLTDERRSSGATCEGQYLDAANVLPDASRIWLDLDFPDFAGLLP